MVKEIGTENKYIIQLQKATKTSANTMGFDHKFNKNDLNRLKKIGENLGLNVRVENNTIEYYDNVVLENRAFNMSIFWEMPPQLDYYEAFCNVIKLAFEVEENVED